MVQCEHQYEKLKETIKWWKFSSSHSHATVRLASAVTCCLSVDTLQEYSPECSTVVSLRVNSVTYTEAPSPDPCFSTNPPLPVTRLPLCIHWTESRLVVTGSEVCISQVSTDDCPRTAFSGVRRLALWRDPVCKWSTYLNLKAFSFPAEPCTRRKTKS